MNFKPSQVFAQSLMLSGLAVVCTSAFNLYANSEIQTAALAQRPSVQVAKAVETQPLSCRTLPSSNLFARTELFFGLSKPDGSEITEVEFQKFLNREVTPRFPDGLTLLAGKGQFKNSKGVTIQEPSRLLILLYPAKQTTNNSQKVEQIRKTYKTAFQQESVLRTDDVSCVSF